MPSLAGTAPTVLTDISDAKRFVRGLDKPSDLMEAAASSTALATHALDIHLEREGKDNHAHALLETAHWLQSQVDGLVELWKTLED